MDSPLALLLSFPPHPPRQQPLSDQLYDEGIRKLLHEINLVHSKHFRQPLSNGNHLLDVINPSLNSVSYAAVLAAVIASPDTYNAERLFAQITTFLETFDARQIRYIGSTYVTIINAAAHLARSTRQPELAITPISDAILRLDPSGSTFTSAHLLLAKLALESNVPSLAFSVLEKHIVHIPATKSLRSEDGYLCSASCQPHRFITIDLGLTSKMKYQDVLEYFVIGGTAYIAVQNWKQALELLECAIVYPSKDHAVSKIMVEAYKKWILVHALLTGASGKLPTVVTGLTRKTLTTLARPYESLAVLFEAGSATALKAEADLGAQLWGADFNTGLVVQLLRASQKFQICNLATLYKTVRISDVTLLTTNAETGQPSPDDQTTERLVAELIANGTLNGTLNSGVLTFTSTGSILSEEDVQQQLAASLTSLKRMAADVNATDRRLTHEREYLKWAAKQKKAKQNGTIDIDAEPADWGLAEPNDEEDLMSDDP